MSTEHKYIPRTKSTAEVYCGRGAGVHPERWCYRDPDKRNQYYAYLKHKAQARYRGESHSLTPDDWFALWANGAWAQRGRASTDLSLIQLDPTGGWHTNNCAVMVRLEYLKRNAEYRAKSSD